MIHDDAPSKSKLVFYGMGNYKNYLSHYVPVIPYGDPAITIDYRPPPIGSEKIFYVVFTPRSTGKIR